jgi:hypothetical protein
MQGKGANKPDQEQPERVWPEYVNGNHFTLNIHGRDKYSERDCEADIKYTHPTDSDVVCTGPNKPAGCVLSTYGNSIFVLTRRLCVAKISMEMALLVSMTVATLSVLARFSTRLSALLGRHTRRAVTTVMNLQS